MNNKMKLNIRQAGLAAAALAVLIAGAFVFATQAQETAADTEKLVIRTAQGEEFLFNIEIADTPETIMRGLMFRSSMPEDHGMLFLFGQERPRNFWMKNTLIPLDIIYIRADGKIGHIHENAIPHDETPLPSNGPALMVLELNGGVTDRLGIAPGDEVIYGASGK